MWEDEKSERDIKTAVCVHMGSWFAFIWGALKATNGLSGGQSASNKLSKACTAAQVKQAPSEDTSTPECLPTSRRFRHFLTYPSW